MKNLSQAMPPMLPCAFAVAVALSMSLAQAQTQTDAQSPSISSTVLPQVVVSANRSAQSRFDAAAAIDVVQIDSFSATTPLVNLSELLSAVPGVQVRNRENYAQDLQVSVRGFGTRSTFGVRGVRILVDGIPATMPDGQGQAATASLTAASRIEVLRGPMAQMYGNAAGGVVQVFTRNPPRAGEATTGMVSVGAGSDGQRQTGAAFAAGNDTIGGMIDVSKFTTDGSRDHSAAERTQLAAKLVMRPSADTTVTAVLNQFDQPKAQDPLGLTRADFEKNPRQVIAAALSFDTRKTITQKQAGLVVDHQLSDSDSLNARLYGGQRQLTQYLGLSGVALNTAGGVVDLDRDYSGAGANWTHKMRVNHLPLNWVVGVETDKLHELRRGFVNNAGTPGDVRRNEDDRARNLDFFAQMDWTFAPQWRATAGIRNSRVKLEVDDHYITAASPNDSGSVEYHNTSPVVGLIWQVTDDMNLYANMGKGFETPTLAEVAYRSNGTGPNLGLLPSTSTQAEVGAKIRSGDHTLDMAVFSARSSNEIVPSLVLNGRSIYQNVDSVERRGAEVSWQTNWSQPALFAKKLTTHVTYTWLDASFQKSYVNAQNVMIAAGNRLPGAPSHSLFADAQYQFNDALSAALEWKTESKVYVNDVNSDVASGYGILNIRSSYGFRLGKTKLFLFGRLDNVLDKKYAGSVIVNDGNSRYYEAAPGRRWFVGLRAAM
ncbi:TonB-dependent receptor family protein [Undibacterium sp. SXout7W]|uniref:TonB-dependent receptor family protein n=1 Tax=Undibacterium sp. SXout7W TaxID=3413049 RepID=UPI003BF35193